ncbi:hypothetical protein ACPA1U_24485, partial [Ectopseudomonas hydrolytica]
MRLDRHQQSPPLAPHPENFPAQRKTGAEAPIDWKSMTFAYIGPQIETLLGWSQASWVSAED